MKLKRVYAQAIIGDKLRYFSGDGFLQSVEFNLGEQERASAVKITLHDPNLKLLNIFFTQFQKQGGIYAPKQLFKDDSTTEAAPNNSATVAGSSDPSGYLQFLTKKYGASDLTALTPLGRICYQALSNINVRAFLDAIAIAELGDLAGAPGLGYGYLFGDVYGKETFDPSKLTTHPLRRRTLSGITSTATGRYQVISIVWLDDTQYSPKGLGLKDFKPISQEILAVARMIYRSILDQVKAGQFETALRGNGKTGNGASWEWASLEPRRYSGQGTPGGRLKTFLANVERTKKSASNTKTPVTETTEEKTTDTAEIVKSLNGGSNAQIDVSRSIRIIVGIGFSSEDLKEYEFILTGIQSSDNVPHQTTIVGKQIKAIAATSDKKFKVWRNISVKTFATQITSAIGGSLEVTDINADTVLNIVQRGETEYKALVRAAQQVGLFVRSEGTTLKIEPLKNDAKTHSIPYNALLPGSTWSETAQENRILNTTNPTNTTAQTEANSILKTLAASSSNTPGILDLSKAANEKEGIGKGFPATLNVSPLLLLDIYEWLPGDIVAINTPYGDSINRKYRIDNVKHSWNAGIVASSIDIYLPVSIVTSGGDTAKSGDSINSTDAATSPEFDKWDAKWKKQAKKGDVIEGTGQIVTSPFGPRISPTAGASSNHKGTDVGCISGTPLYPIVKNGKTCNVRYTPNLGGAGNIVEYEYENLSFRYFHLRSGRSGSFGDNQVIAYSGSTGVGTAAHLHVEIYETKNGLNGRYAIPLGYLYWILTGNAPS